MTYQEKLKNPKWQKKRLEILERDNWTCTNCGDTENELHVHHEKYENQKNPWETSNDNLATLCKNCHFIFTFLPNDHVVKVMNMAFNMVQFKSKKEVNNG